MKRRLLLLTFLGLMSVLPLMANHAHSILKVRMHNNQPIVVVVDGYQYGPASPSQRIEGIEGGFHHIKIISEYRYPHSWNTTRQVVFNGRVNITPGMEIRALVDYYGRFQVVEQYALNYGPNIPTPGVGPGTCGVVDVPGNRPPVGYGNGWGQGGYNNGYGQGNTPCNQCGSLGNCTHHGGQGGYFGHTTGYTQEPVYGPQPMHQADFNALLRAIDTKSFDNTKEQIAMGAISSNYFTAEQVRLMLQLFTFESTRLRVAKAAYGSVLDPDRFYLVYDAFTFESSISDLNAFIYNS